MPVFLSNLLSGFVGAIVGVAGLLYVQRVAQREARRAAGRAVLAEMYSNADRALSARSTFVLHEFTDFAWQQQMPLVAQMLSWNELKILVTTYDSAARAFENAKDAMTESAKDANQELSEERAFGRISSWFSEVAQEWVTAMHILERAVLNRSELNQFNEDIQKLESQLK